MQSNLMAYRANRLEMMIIGTGLNVYLNLVIKFLIGALLCAPFARIYLKIDFIAAQLLLSCFIQAVHASSNSLHITLH